MKNRSLSRKGNLQQKPFLSFILSYKVYIIFVENDFNTCFVMETK